MIRLRDASADDVPGFFEMDRVCFPEGIAYSLAEMQSILASLKTIGLVAEDDETLAGFVLAQSGRLRGSHGGHIVTIDVDREYRRRGVGVLLMEQIEERMRAAGADWLRLEVAVDNLGALSFYVRLGFKVIGRIRGYYMGELDALVMEKVLKKVLKSKTPGPAPP